MSKELFFGLLLLLTFAQWVAYFKYVEWRRNRFPEPQQGKPVDRVLWHLISDYETPWDAGTSWEKRGRGYIVALQRQGLDEILDERDVSDHKPAYTLGYCVREEEDRKVIDALKKQVERSDKLTERQAAEIERLKVKLSQRPERRPEPQPVPRENIPPNFLNAAWEEWGRCGDSLDTILRRQGLQRIDTAAQPPTPEPVPLHIVEAVEAEEVEDEDTTPDYTALSGDERKAKMTELKDSGYSYSQIGQMFDVSAGCVKSTVSQWRKHSKAEPLETSEDADGTDGLEGVC